MTLENTLELLQDGKLYVSSEQQIEKIQYGKIFGKDIGNHYYYKCPRCLQIHCIHQSKVNANKGSWIYPTCKNVKCSRQLYISAVDKKIDKFEVEKIFIKK